MEVKVRSDVVCPHWIKCLLKDIGELSPLPSPFSVLSLFLFVVTEHDEIPGVSSLSLAERGQLKLPPQYMISFRGVSPCSPTLLVAVGLIIVHYSIGLHLHTILL
jgi:hypothetical protein